MGDGLSQDAVPRLHALITRWRAAFERLHPGWNPERPKAFDPDELDPEVAAGYLRAIGEELDGDPLFDVIDDCGTCRPQGLRAAYCYELIFERDKKKQLFTLWKEWLVHAAAVGKLHYDLDYPRDRIAVEVDAFDALVYSSENAPLIAAEAKRSADEVIAILATMEKWQGKDFELRCREPCSPNGGNVSHQLSNAEKKVRGLLALRPRYFWATGPGISSTFNVSYPTPQRIEMHHFGELPPTASNA